MFALIPTDLEMLKHVITSPFMLVGLLFQLWMFIAAIRRREWMWAAFIIFFSIISAVLYFFMVYRSGGGLATRGFELPGTHSRRRIKELQARIHHLDKPHHHLQLGDIYFQRGKLDLAETHYRASIERDGTDRDARAHLGQCLLRKKRPAEAQPLLEAVANEDAKHDYGHTLMALAETHAALGHADASVQVWERVLQHHSYARARVQLAELYLNRGDKEQAREQAREVVDTEPHAPAFERRRNRVWLRRAKGLLRRARQVPSVASWPTAHGRDEGASLLQRAAGRKNLRPSNTSSPSTISAHVPGSGTVGTLNGSAGVRPVAAYCCWVSSTTAPLTDVTSCCWPASATASAVRRARTSSFTKSATSHSLGNTTSQGAFRAFLIRAAVLTRMSCSPASIRWTLRMFRSASSASYCWLIPLAIRSRRMLSPTFLSEALRDLGGGTRSLSEIAPLTETAYAP